MSFLRKLFSRRAEPAIAPATAVLPRPVTAPIRFPVPPAYAVPTNPDPASTPAEAAGPPEDCVALPLKAITDLFPPELKASLRKQPSEHIQVHIPRDLLRQQLAAGAVRITFAQLRAATPEIFFNPDGAPADAKLLLPLESVVRLMTPCRRDDQRQPCIPVNIPSIFLKADKAGEAGSIGTFAGGSKEAWYSQRRPTYEAQPEPEPEPKAAASLPANKKKPFHPLASVTERPRRESEQAAVPSIPPAPAITPTPPDSFAIPLSAVMAALPPEIRHALNGTETKQALLFIPLGEFEARMRTGKVVFKWGQLRDWWSGASVAPNTPALADFDVDLPLAAVVPLFMAARKAPDARKQVEVDTRIPDVFSKPKISSRVLHIAPQTPVSAGPAPTLAPPPPQPVAPQPAPPLPEHASTTPAQIVQDLRALDGVAGAFIATADGLLVAGDVPDANENVLAAFAPAVFAQFTKYTDMARLGPPESIDIHLADGATVHVRKAGRLYLGVLVPNGLPLPVQELTRISTALQPTAP